MSNVPSAAPSLARSLVIVLSPKLDTQTLVPSKAMSAGFVSTVMVCKFWPSLARSLVTVPPKFAPRSWPRQRLGRLVCCPPEKANPPPVGSSFVTVLSPELATQKWVPSKVKFCGAFPTGQCEHLLCHGVKSLQEIAGDVYEVE